MPCGICPDFVIYARTRGVSLFLTDGDFVPHGWWFLISRRWVWVHAEGDLISRRYPQINQIFFDFVDGYHSRLVIHWG